MRLLLPFLLAAGLLCAQNTSRLYLKDGEYHRVREYQVLQDRVRFFSVERGEWEEMPLDLVDLKRTRSEAASREAELKADEKSIREEEEAAREARREIARIPAEPGVYQSQGESVTTVPQAEAKVVNNKRRSILKAITPVPIVAGKSTLEIDGLQSKHAVTGERPEFVLRLDAIERFAIVKLTPLKTSRLVETWNTIPVTKEVFQEHQEIEIFRRQIAENLFKIWPTKPLPPGEYAVIQWTEGKANTKVWDFAKRGTP